MGECDAKFKKELKRVIDWFDQFFKNNQFAFKSKKDVCNLIDDFPKLRAESFSLNQKVEKKQQGCKTTTTMTTTTTTTTTTEPPRIQPPKTKNHSSVNVPKIWYFFFVAILIFIF